MTQIGKPNLFGIKVVKNENNIKKEAIEKQTAEQSEIKDTNLNEAPNGHYGRVMVNKVSNQLKNMSKHTKDFFRACLVGGAIGDAVGRPIERVRIWDIKSRYGKDGIQDMATVGLKGRFTDDTQMTIFTADGLIKSALKTGDTKQAPDYNVVYDSYKDWYTTQVEGRENEPQIMNDQGWVGELEELYYPNGAGRNTLAAMKNGIMGTPEAPINDAKSCGAVMRVAPVGLMYYDNPELAFEVGVRCGAMTHCNPTAYLPAGTFAAMVAYVIQGDTPEVAFDKSIEILKKHEHSEDLVSLLEKAKEYAHDDKLNHEVAIDKLGQGWNGDEALAITAYCVLKEPHDFRKAILMAVNHNGDSDSTGAMVGNILGAYLGMDKLPSHWAKNVELSNEISQLADDLYAPEEIENAHEKYPLN